MNSHLPVTAASARLTILVPVYRSEATIGELVDSVVETVASQANLWEIILVNDGSPDNSHAVILQAMERHPGLIRYVRLYRNFGEHNAVMCGLNYVTGDCVAIIDDDFQNPPDQIVGLVKRLYEGDFDVVYSYYEKKQHSWFRNAGSRVNDIVATLLLKKPRNLYLSSFKVMSADLVKLIVQYRGPFPYIDGLILRTTTRIGTQLVQHETRKEGKSSYTFAKLISLWLNMSTGFSVTPLRLAALLGLAISFVALLMVIAFTVEALTANNLPPGWASTIVTITFFAGLQLCVLGMMGEYLGRLFLTVNGAPQFLIRDTHGIEAERGIEKQERTL
jgi:glycosyltransferase involved in cell wall biosynthesis